MTLLVNVLHKDFSLLAADRRAITGGPTTIKVGNVTIQSGKGATITGFAKLHANADKSVALGIAGDAIQHLYVTEFERTRGINDAILLIDSHIAKYLRLTDREQFLGMVSLPKQEGILSFFDAEIGYYFSLLYEFSFIHKSIQMQKAPDSGLRLIGRGSGCNHFASLQLEESLNRLATETTVETDYNKCLNWLIPIYDSISKQDSNVSASIVAWASVRSRAHFQEVFRS